MSRIASLRTGVLGSAVLTALLGASFVGMAVAAASGRPVWFFACAAISYLADAGLVQSRVNVLLRRWQMGVTFRFTLRELLLVALYVQNGRPATSSVIVLLVGLAGAHVVRLGFLYLFARARRTRRGLLRWLNLDVDGQLSAPEPLVMVGPAWPSLAGARLALHLDVIIAAGVAASWRHSGAPLTVAVVLVAAAGAALWSIGLRQFLVERAKPSVAERNSRLHAALAERAPEVAVYFSSAISSTYALNVWLETIDRLERPAVIYLRELGHLANLGPTTTPVVVLPTAPSVQRFHLPTLRVALYPTTVIKNNHMLRLTGIRHIFINHGDGDKSVTYSPLHRVFDEVWVAGAAARDRYLTHEVGVRDEQIHLVGRPQLAHIDRAGAAASAPFTVLYAPTWEGNFDGVDYSSVAPMGVGIMRALLSSPVPIRVLLKPHPATGQRSAAARQARAAVERMVVEAGAPHRLVETGPDALYEAFNQSDLLVADVSSVVADYLASRKPYIVTNPRGLDPDTYRSELPSTSGGYLLGPDLTGFSDMIADALGPDSLRDRRRELAAYFLGADVADPIAHFVDLVSVAVDEQSRRIAQAEPDHAMVGVDGAPVDALPEQIGPDISTVVP